MRVVALLLLLSKFSLAQTSQVPLLFDNKTSGTFTCVSVNGQVMSVTEKENQFAAIIPANKSVPVLLVASGNGSILWLDKASGKTVKLQIDYKPSLKFTPAGSPSLSKTVSKAAIGSLEIYKIEVTEQLLSSPKRPVEVSQNGNATLISMMRVNINETGKPKNNDWQSAFDFSILSPSKFYTSTNGNAVYNGEKGIFTDEKYLPAVTEQSIRFSTNEKGDSIVDVFITARQLPSGVPLTVSFVPLQPAAWERGTNQQSTPLLQGRYYKVFAVEEDPGSPYTAQAESFGRFAFFHCEGIIWKKFTEPAQIIDSKNFMEHLKTWPGVPSMQHEKIKVIQTAVPRPGDKKILLSKPINKVTTN